MRLKLFTLATSALIFASACKPQPDSNPDQNPSGDVKLPGGKADVIGAEDDSGRFASNFFRRERGYRALRPVSIDAAIITSRQLDVIVSLLKDQLGPAIITLPPEEFELISTREQPIRGATLHHITLAQTVDGVPIADTALGATLRVDSSGAATLVAASYKVYQDPTPETSATLDIDAALGLAREAARVDPLADPTNASLAIRELQGRLHLVYHFSFDTSEKLVAVIAAGPNEGRAVAIDTTLAQTSGRVRGVIARQGAPGARGAAETIPLEGVEIFTDPAAGMAAAVTDVEGRFLLEGMLDAPVQAWLQGPSAFISDADGQDLFLNVEPGDGPIDVVLGDDSPASLAQTTTYHYTTLTRRFLEDNGADPEVLGPALTAVVNIDDACNAFYSPEERSINFFKAGALDDTRCNSTAEDTVVIHEYGHFADDMFGGITDFGLSEGWGDLLSCFILDDPIIGRDLFVDDPKGLRTCDNTYQYPADGHDEVHALGQAWAGFAWHAREELIAKHGEEAGDELARALIIPSLTSNAFDIPTATLEVFLRDDDDGDLSNGSPNFDELLRAATLHNLQEVAEFDAIPPARIADLEILDASPTALTVQWTAPGDDGDQGTAAFYSLKLSTQPIDEDNFDFALDVGSLLPAEAGTLQQETIFLDGEQEVFLAIVAFDNQGNRGPISNIARAKPGAGRVVFTESAEDGIGAWEATGLWHVTEQAAAHGARAFWYGQEESGNYDTGDENAGTLRSPVISLRDTTSPFLNFQHFGDYEAGLDFDAAIVTVRTVDGSISQSFDAEEFLPAFSAGFKRTGISLAGFRDQDIFLEFSFATGDDAGNATTGWIIDKVEILDLGAEPLSTALVINEILADPAPGYDANNDGVASTREDEFVELVNVSAAPLELGGARIEDNIGARFTFPDQFTLAPGAAVVVFGGGAPAIDGVRTLVAKSGLYLNNRGDHLKVRARNGRLLTHARYDGSFVDTSATRAQEATPRARLIEHSILGQTASPGVKANGEVFAAIPETRKLTINEIFASPRGFDSNNDGVFDSRQDEFVELFNPTGDAIDLSGATISDQARVRGVFPDGTVLEPGMYLVVFAGGQPDVFFDHVVVGSLGLNDSGDVVVIASAAGEVLASANYGAEGGEFVSLTRLIDGQPNARLVRHDERDGQTASPGEPSTAQQ